MIITRTPFRITLGGGGTDLPEFYSKHGGLWLNATIGKYVYVSVKSRFEKELRVAYSRIEEVTNPNDIRHPIIHEAFNHFSIRQNLEMSTIADLPAGAGLGSSGAFTVGLIKALSSRYGERLPERDIAELAYTIERDGVGRTIGKQDQYSAAFGGVKLYTCGKDGFVTPHNLPVYDLMDHILLVYTSRVRDSEPLLAEVAKSEQQMLKIMDYGKQSVKALLDSDYKELGQIMGEHWTEKKSISPNMSSTQIDKYYSRCLRGGAFGGKLVGAGGGGFLMFIVPDEEAKRAIIRITNPPFTPIQCDLSLTGSEVIQW